jgi:single-strand DNA-binding protein
MNKAILIGMIASDPELRYTKNGQPILNLRLRTTKKWNDASGAPRERSDTHSVVFWGKRGEGLSSVLCKDVMIVVEGEIQNSSYEKDGQKIWKTEINASAIDLVSDDVQNRRDTTPAPARNEVPFGGRPDPYAAAGVDEYPSAF